ncbi:ATP-binding protein [Cytobacillus sp. IB215665]|uniref:hybrid sensor histidine kinase/response regulator n=1 Tax=Cytobacillus sp. IB215665 TaxID=3097357 RepID=UPI002A167981|nr:ATP-binding protein [Cytobacillus sp. IB215665]MDX8366085.1 ATP-binding protein [Cytobacillus sp. IB215665]
MKTKLVAIQLLLLITLIVAGTLYYIATHHELASPSIEDGVLDLSQWDHENDGVIRLDGEWEFYPNKLLNANDFKTNSSQKFIPQFVKVPNITWTSYENGNQAMSPYGKATYRLKVNVQDDQHIYGIKTPSFIIMSNKLFLNGELLGSSGEPNDESLYTPGTATYVTYFTLNKGMNEIILQVANYDYSVGGGIFTSIYFGDQQQISKLRDRSLMNDWVPISVFLIMGLYFIGLYSQRKKDYFLLLFSIYCLATGIFKAVHGELVWYTVFPNTPHWIVLRLQYVSFMLSNLSLVLYIYAAFKNVVSKKFVWFVASIGLLLTLYELIFPAYIPFWVRNTTSLYSIFAMVFAVYVMILAFLQKMEGSIYLILGSIAMSVHMFKYFIVIDSFIAIDNPIALFPFEPFILLLMLALLMSLRFSNAFKRNEQLSEELLRVDKVKDEFLAKTSHEFKTPLHGIINISSFLLENEDQHKSQKYKDNLSLIHDTSIKLSNLVNDLIDVTRLKNGEFRLNTTKVDIKVSTQIVFDVLAFEIQGKQIHLINGIDESLFAVADENRLRQILYNLIQNAIKHTEHGEIIVSAKSLDQQLYIYVEDTGIGIPEEKFEEIFGYFEQLDKLSPQNGYQSMGLGLYISKQLIEKMGGDIWVDWSEVGKGTRFAFKLPIATCSEHENNEESVEQTVIPSNSIILSKQNFDKIDEYENTILVVDDEPSNITILHNLLSSHHYNVITAYSAKDALRKLEQYKNIDLVILDVMMPVMSGIELCQKIRETHSLLELPILFSTVNDLPEDIELGFKAGANDYVTKPFEANTIIARIQTLLSMKTSMEEAFHNEMAFLQAQIKPHFLYNAISNIISFCFTDGQKAAHLLTMLSQYLRIIYSSDHKTMLVPLQQELDLVNAFVEIEKARFEQFEFRCEIGEGLDSVHIPSLCIQPLVENAIRHGLFEKEGRGYVSLTIKEYGKHILVQIEDNGVGMTNDVLQQFRAGKIKNAGIGMTNIKKRLESINGSYIEVHSRENEGTRVNIQLPKCTDN